MKTLPPRPSRLCLEELEDRNLLSGFDPTPAEQLLLEQLNDIRANPAAYGAAIGVDLTAVSPAQPLAFNPRLVEAARTHAQDMNDRGYFSRNTPNGTDPGQRLTDAGVAWTAWGESSAAGTAFIGSADVLKALVVDTGVSDLKDRKHLLAVDSVFRDQNQAGIGVVGGGNGPLVNYYTLDTAATTDPRPFLTGVVFRDQNGNGKYDGGEGLPGVTVTVASVATTTTFASGGYSIQVNPGSYTVSASGGAMPATMSRAVTVGSSNFRFNFIVPATGATTTTSSFSFWVGLLYRDLLGRVPGAGEVNGWVDALQHGSPRESVTSAFLSSQEYSAQQVQAWFQRYLDRDADPGALSAFGAMLGNGVSAQSILLAILGSPEYFNSQGGTASSFVAAVYHDLLNRTYQGNEADPWITMANANNRSGVVSGLLASTEFTTSEVKALYGKYLRRAADTFGLSNFTRILGAGTDMRLISRALISSDEYFTAAPDILWFRQLYRDVLGREGDGPAEVGGWLTAQRGGTNRTALAQALLASKEGAGRFLSNLYQRLLARDPDSSGLNLFTGQLQGGGFTTGVVLTLASSGEYFVLHGSGNRPFIRALYQDLLQRTPAETEITLWENMLNGTTTRMQVVAGFLASNEYQQLLISSLFLQYLRRSPTTSELNQGVNLLRTGSHEFAVAASLLASQEYFVGLVSS